MHEINSKDANNRSLLKSKNISGKGLKNLLEKG